MPIRISVALLFAVLMLDMRSAEAIVITLDNPSPTVVRPSIGFIPIDFTGHIDISEGFEPAGIQASTLVNELGDQLDSQFPMPRFDSGHFNLTGVLFSLWVNNTDALGLYRLVNAASMEPVFIRYFECPIGSTEGCVSSTVNYSLNIVDRIATPEPLSMALFAIGLVGLWRAARNRSARS